MEALSFVLCAWFLVLGLWSWREKAIYHFSFAIVHFSFPLNLCQLRTKASTVSRGLKMTNEKWQMRNDKWLSLARTQDHSELKSIPILRHINLPPKSLLDVPGHRICSFRFTMR